MAKTELKSIKNNKGVYEITFTRTDRSKSKDNLYQFNINTGELIGVHGKAIKSLPISLRAYARRGDEKKSVLLNEYELFEDYLGSRNKEYLSLLQLSEKVNNLVDRNVYIERYYCSSELIELVNSNFSLFMDYINEEDWRGYARVVISLSGFRDYYNKIILKEKIKGRIDNAEDLEYALQTMTRLNHNYINDTNITFIINVIRQGIRYLCNSYINFENILSNYFKCCKRLGLAIEKNNNFIKEYARVMELYKGAEDKIRNEIVEKVQTKKDIAFENDRYICIIPKTYQELVNEGVSQHNCMSGHEYNNYIEPERRCVAFIRKKDNPNQSYISCDIDLDTGRIIQYLYAYNRDVRDRADLDFRLQYQKHLDKVWGN